MGQPGRNLAAINVEAAFGDIFDFCFDLWIPFSEVVDSLSDFIKGYVAFLPFWHLENFENGQNFSYFLIILFDIILGNAEILSDLFVHFTSDSVELNWLRNDASDICQFIRFFLSHVSAFDFGRNSVYAFHNVDHVFERVFNVVFEILFVRIEVHVLFLDTNVKKTGFSLFFHFVKQESHWLMINSYQGFDHHKVNELDEITESLLVSVCDFK